MMMAVRFILGGRGSNREGDDLIFAICDYLRFDICDLIFRIFRISIISLRQSPANSK
jgi:hypothetical protein